MQTLRNLGEILYDKSMWDNQTYKMAVRLENVRVSVLCVLYCILVR